MTSSSYPCQIFVDILVKGTRITIASHKPQPHNQHRYCLYHTISKAISTVLEMYITGNNNNYCVYNLWYYFPIMKNRCQQIPNYNDVIMGAMALQISSFAIVYSNVYSGADQRKHQSSASLAFAQGIHRWPVNSPHKSPVTRKMFPFDDVIMLSMSNFCCYFSKRDTDNYCIT